MLPQLLGPVNVVPWRGDKEGQGRRGWRGEEVGSPGEQGRAGRKALPGVRSSTSVLATFVPPVYSTEIVCNYFFVGDFDPCLHLPMISTRAETGSVLIPFVAPRLTRVTAHVC